MRARGAPVILRRLAASRLVLSAVLLNTVAAAALAAALASFAGQALGQAVRHRLETAPGVWVAMNGPLTLGQTGAETAAIRSAFHATFGAVPVTLYRCLWSHPLELTAGRLRPSSASMLGAAGAPTALIQAAAPDRVRAMTTLVSGRWPPATGTAGAGRGNGRPIPAALPAAAAGLLHVRPGSLLSLRDRDTGARVRIRLTGTFRPVHPAAGYWALNLIGGSAASAQGGFVTYGPLIVDPGVFATGELGTDTASWVAVPDRQRIGGDLTALAGRVTRMTSAFSFSSQFGGLTVSTSLPALLAGLGADLVVARSVLVTGGLLLLILVAAALLLASRVLAGWRDTESATLSARGGSPGQLVRLNTAESVVLGVVAAVAGALLGGRLAALLAAAGPLRAAGLHIGTVPPAAWLAAAAATLTCVAFTLGPALRPALPGAARLRRGRPAVVAGAARAGGDIALIALALLAGWQLRRYSIAATAGGPGFDPVLAIAPALGLVAGTVVLMRLLPLFARAGDRLAVGSRRLVGTLAVWEISRNPVRKGGAALIVVLGVATGTIALAQHQSWQRSQSDQAAFTTGADIRVDTPGPVPLARAGTIAHARGALGATAVTRVPLVPDGSLIALDARSAASTVLLRPDLSPLRPAALWRRLIPARAAGMTLPGRPARLEITAALGPPALRLPPAAVTMSVQDGSGAVYSVPAGTILADGRSHDLVASLSPGRRAVYPLRLLTISASYQLPTAKTGLRAAFTLHSAAVSADAEGGFSAPFISGRAFRGWTPAVSAAELDPGYLNAPTTPKPDGPIERPSVANWTTAAQDQRLTFEPGYAQLVGLGAGGTPVAGSLTLDAAGPGIPVIPGIATQGYLRARQASVGGIVQVTVADVVIPVRIVAAVAAFPTVTGAGGALLVDQASVAGILASQSAQPLAVSQWWLRTTSPDAPRGLPPGVAVTDRARVTAALLSDPLTAVPQQALLAIALAATLLAAAGFALSVVTDAAGRGQRAALLAALGLSPAQQARLHCAQELMLSVPAAGIGLLLGSVLARVLVPAVTLTATATRPFPPVLVEFSWTWAVLIAVVVAAVPALAALAVAARRPDPAAKLRAAEAG